jgi:nicotinamidase-related amidase
VIQRGGYLEARLERLDHPAVLVVDMLNDFAHPDGAYARHGAVCTALPAIVPQVRHVMEVARAAGVPVLSAHQVVYADRDGRAITGGGMQRTRPWLADEGLRPGTWGTGLIEELPEPDLSFDKPRASAFFGTPLDVILRGLATQTLVIVGCFTNQCVVSTARDAWARDLDVVIAVDGVAAFDERLHLATLESLRPLTVQLSAEEIARLLGPRGATSSC